MAYKFRLEKPLISGKLNFKSVDNCSSTLSPQFASRCLLTMSFAKSQYSSISCVLTLIAAFSCADLIFRLMVSNHLLYSFVCISCELGILS